MRAVNIEWDTDGADIRDVGLPTEVEIPYGTTDIDDISDYLSDKYGYLHYCFELVEK